VAVGVTVIGVVLARGPASDLLDTWLARGPEARAARLAREARAVAEGIQAADTRDVVLAEVSAVLTRAGRVRKAQAVASDIRDRVKQVSALLAVTQIALEAGRATDAVAVARQASAAAEDISGDWRLASDLRSVALALAKAGLPNEARALAEAAARRAKAAAEGSRDLSAGGTLDMVYMAAETLVEVGQVDEALVLTQGMPATDLLEEVSYAPNWLVSFAGALARAGRMDEARRVLSRFGDAEQRGAAFWLAAEIVAKAGKTEEALALARNAATDPSAVLAAVAQALAEAGSVARAQEVALEINDPASRASALYNVSVSALRKGAREEAAAAARRFLEAAPAYAAAFEAEIPVAMVITGRTDEAFRKADQIRLDIVRAGAFGDMAEVLIRAGQPSKALAAASKVKAISRTLGHDILLGAESPKPRRLPSDIAMALVKAGYLDEAMRVAEGIISPQGRAEVLVATAEAAVQAGKPTLALAAVEKARSVVGMMSGTDGFASLDKSTLLGNIATVLSRLGRTDDALAAAGSIKESGPRNWAIAAVAGALARAGNMEGARAVANQASDPSTMVRAFAEADRIDEALAFARRITDPASRASNLISVAQVLIERRPRLGK